MSMTPCSGLAACVQGQFWHKLKCVTLDETPMKQAMWSLCWALPPLLGSCVLGETLGPWSLTELHCSYISAWPHSTHLNPALNWFDLWLDLRPASPLQISWVITGLLAGLAYCHWTQSCPWIDFLALILDLPHYHRLANWLPSMDLLCFSCLGKVGLLSLLVRSLPLPALLSPAAPGLSSLIE